MKRAGKRVELTAKEYGVLEYLMANAGRVLSRTMILEHVWDQSFDGATNIVDGIEINSEAITPSTVDESS